jgi:serine/threonine-protein kinase
MSSRGFDEHTWPAEDAHPGPGRCPHCHTTGRLAAVAARAMRCHACDFVWPLPRQPRTLDTLPPLDGLTEIAPGCILRDRYRLIELIGRGAHGLTYYAEHEFLNHPCVVKILPQRIQSPTDAAAQRLRNEASAGFRVNDPHVVRVLDCDAIAGIWYFVMEYTDGVDLGELISAGVRLGWQQTLNIALDAATGLAAIHRAGLLHRDIKPANLLLGTDGRARLTDLGVVGLANLAPATSQGLTPGPVGTPLYAAPEALEAGAAVGFEADLYSLGATLFHALTGRAPHAHDSVFEVLLSPHTHPVAWPDDAPADVPTWFIDTILRLLRSEPAQRLRSAELLAEHLRRPRAVPETPIQPAAVADERQPRGLAVLPFDNQSGATEDDWLGFALADSLSRELSRTPGTYIVDPDQLLAVLARHAPEAGPADVAELRAAGALVGAATVIAGAFRRAGDEIRICAHVCRHDNEHVRQVEPLHGPLSKLVNLQAALFLRVADAAQLAATRAAAAEPALEAIPLEAHERFARGKQAYLQGKYEIAIRLAREAVEQDPNLIEALEYMSICFARLGRYAEATDVHERIVAVAEERGDDPLLLAAEANMGVLYYLKGEHEVACNHYALAAEIAERNGLEKELAQIENNKGFALFRLGRPEAAEHAFKRAIAVSERFGALAALIGPHNGLGNLLLQQKRYDEAREHYRWALGYAQEIGDRTNTGVCHTHMGRCASLQGLFTEAKNEFTLALNTLEDTSFWNVRARTYEYIADMNLRLGNYAEAIRCADEKIELARRHENRTMEAVGWRLKGEALRRLGRTAEADDCLTRGKEAGTEGAGAPG